MPSDKDGVTMSLQFSDAQPIAALDLSALLFDINRLYVVGFRAEQDPFELNDYTLRG